MTYAKLNDNKLEVLTRLPNCGNPTSEMLEIYAATNGYKPYTRTDAPNPYYAHSYEETDTGITDVWTPIALEDAKEDALARIQANLDEKRTTRCTIPCDGLPNGIVCDPESRNMCMGLVILGDNVPDGLTWTDAADEIHELTTGLLAAISAAYVGFLGMAQNEANDARAFVRNATTVDEVWDAVHA